MIEPAVPVFHQSWRLGWLSGCVANSSKRRGNLRKRKGTEVPFLCQNPLAGEPEAGIRPLTAKVY